MPIKIPNDLPARTVLDRERVPVITEDVALRQDIRPLQIALLNLMPEKIKTETQLLRVLGATPLQVEMTLLRPATHESKNTPQEHLTAFYNTWQDVRHRRFDALIVTGAPVEHLAYEQVTYWQELTEILDWTRTHVFSSLFICWGAQAALYHFHRLPKYDVGAKRFGVFRHRTVKPFEPLTSGFDDNFFVPVSRYTEVRPADVVAVPGLEILVESDQSGICLIQEAAARRIYMFNHLEYDAETLLGEYRRDRDAGLETALPFNYFPDDDPDLAPRMTWRAHRTLLFGNWINMVYQGTPYDLEQLAPGR
ncbi:homoserine O-succinyltransferase [Rhodopila sp.]|jgi:homoserine O-succinyltransferase|uniref:homoserine O-succinyltransferase n=1 Tax=Rhodopila sp. TaxID=2480087 RepID=UPI002C88F8EC|nr:homoserine O-succinyltransferase [Rhodopila sp.]HVZ08533.1 homoserine O-succinyltransferase [Rhodopila sp.]